MEEVIIEQVASGGSGYGDPKLRPKEVRNELVSIESALHDYGVSRYPKPLEINETETTLLREDVLNYLKVNLHNKSQSTMPRHVPAVKRRSPLRGALEMLRDVENTIFSKRTMTRVNGNEFVAYLLHVGNHIYRTSSPGG